MNGFNGRRCVTFAALTATGWATLCRESTAKGAELFAQAAGAAAVEPQSGTDFVIPGIVVVVLFAAAVYAVCRSSHRV